LKKINYKKIFVVLFWLFTFAGLTTTLGFISKREKNVIARELNINIFNADENPFLSDNDVKQFLAERKEPVLNTAYKDIDIPGLEKALNSHPAIENAEVSGDINGEIKIDITQRTPVLRVINKDGESYYIDSQSKLMPLNDNYSARVLVATGEIYEPFARNQP
jgi:cell division protein FtsQ